MSMLHEEEKPWWKGAFNYFLEVVKVFLIALAIVVPVRYFLVQPFYVKGSSMVPNFEDHEYLIIDELSFRFRAPERGEVVVFRYPKNPRQYYIKRIVGLPGETVSIEDGLVYLIDDTGNKQQLDEAEYLDEELKTQGYNYSQVTLQDNEYYVMGDNRNASYDSRQFGPLEEDFIVGRAMVRVLPLDRIDYFER
ncbi:MAG: signal peptidase I [Patescibacteria group bacterium]